MSTFAASSLFQLAGAVCVVTGGGTGIGLMASKALAAAGARVYITGRRAEVLQRAASAHSQGLPGSLVPFACDVTKRDELLRLVAELKDKEGKVHVLINNAGVEGPCTKLDPEAKKKMTAEELSQAHLDSESMDAWSQTFALNNHALWFASMAFLPLLSAGNKAPPTQFGSKAAWKSTIINITSISGLVKTAQNHYAYNSSKAAANHLTSMLAHELAFSADLGLRVNALAPGLFPSEMTAGAASANGETDESAVTGHANPAGRTGTKEEMASAILFLATNTFVTGTVLPIDGGFTSAVACTR